MSRRERLLAGAAILLVGALAMSTSQAAEESAGPKTRFFELRTYTTVEGRLEALKARFRDHTNDLFRKHGMEIIGFWTPTEGPKSGNTLIYILAYPGKDARERSWKEFQADPEWVKARTDSEKDGKIVAHVDSVYMSPTDFSPIK